MEIALTAFTILGGLAAIWFFWDKLVALWGWIQSWGQPEQIDLAMNPTRENIETVILSSDPTEDWNHVTDAVGSVTSYRKDMNLRFQIRYIDDGIQRRDFKEPWASHHPDPSATGYWCDLFYGATRVERFILVAVDGGRAMLPIPKIGPENSRPNIVLPLDYKVAQIHDTLGVLDEYITRSGLIKPTNGDGL